MQIAELNEHVLHRHARILLPGIFLRLNLRPTRNVLGEAHVLNSLQEFRWEDVLEEALRSLYCQMQHEFANFAVQSPPGNRMEGSTDGENTKVFRSGRHEVSVGNEPEVTADVVFAVFQGVVSRVHNQLTDG